MFTVICFFRVKDSQLDSFLKMARQSGEILESHGTLQHHMFFSHEATGRQGSMGMLNLIEVEEDEELLLGQTLFKDEQHYHEVMASIGFNDIIHYLSNHIKDIVEMNKVVTSTFNTEKPETPISEQLN
ncbi:DUF1428 family protein [Halobacillus litoralis]|uniref:DUF1428 family protein n=1 Tax=Halobacillus litoralis TaxID=45668 RepID=UPI001CD6339D|nr:DUF1428 family protein [Halobacillus litoralis]MCA0971942.1 DUF1428 family protein [Halobacillus litoralis]